MEVYLISEVIRRFGWKEPGGWRCFWVFGGRDGDVRKGGMGCCCSLDCGSWSRRAGRVGFLEGLPSRSTPRWTFV